LILKIKIMVYLVEAINLKKLLTMSNLKTMKKSINNINSHTINIY